MPPQQLRQILRKRRPRQNHVASYFVRLLLQISLHVRQKSDDRRPLLQLALQLRNQRQRLGIRIIQIKNQQRRLLFPVLLQALRQIFIVLDELDLHVQLARRLLNLRRKKQILDERKYARIGVFPHGQRLRLTLRILCRKPRTLPPRLVPIAVQDGAIAVIHGRGINAVRILAILLPVLSLPLSRALASRIRRPPSPPPPVSSSASGGSSRSCVHSPLKYSRSLISTLDCLQFFQSLAEFNSRASGRSFRAQEPLLMALLAARFHYVARTHTWKRSPTLETQLSCEPTPIYLRIDFPLFGSVAPPREGLAWKACAGTRPNENILILLVSATRRKAHRPSLLHRRTWLPDRLPAFRYPASGFDQVRCE
jgi:hypothetical protein